MLLLAAVGCAAPSLVVKPPADAPVAGVVTLDVATDAAFVTFSVDGGEPIDPAPLDTRGWPDGAHTIEVSARGWLTWPATTRVALTTDNAPPRVSLTRRARAVEQGHTLPIVVATDEPATVTARFLDEDRPLYELGEHTWRALVGVPIRTEPGRHLLALTATDALGNTVEHEVPVEVLAVDWPFTGKLPLSRRKAKVDPPAMVQMRQERDAVYATATPEARWSGLLALPVQGADHTSPFGTFREYPDGTRSFHDAEDLARKRWTPIHAAADGIVALAHYQEVHGNAVLLDHGQQVITLYSHLQKLNVQAGQAVQTGDLLGWMGNTGRSTGPHLHWGIVVDQVAVDPMQWTAERFDGFDDLEPLESVEQGDPAG